MVRFICTALTSLALLAAPFYAPSAHATPTLPSPKDEIQPVTLSCVEQVWCDIAQQIGGAALNAHALITTEGLDPHHIQPSPHMVQEIAHSEAVLLNGATYDDWAQKFTAPHAKLFLVSSLSTWQEGDDPHLFFDLTATRNTAHQLAAWLITIRPQTAADITRRLAEFDAQLAQLTTRLDGIRTRYQGAPFAMTEPAGERLLRAAGLSLIDQSWARALMNETGLSPRDTAALEGAIFHHEIRFLVRNPTVTAPQAETIEALAQQQHIPVIAIGESLPHGLQWHEWITQLLDHIEQALKQSAPSNTVTHP